MAKKAKSVEAKKVQELNQLVKDSMEYEVKETPVNIVFNDTEYEILVKQHLPIQMRNMIEEKVLEFYFENNDYFPEFGDACLGLCLFTAYTNISFGDNIEAFEKFSSNVENYGHILPGEAVDLEYNIRDKIKFMKDRYAESDEARNMHDAMTSLFEMAERALSAINDSLGKLANAADNNDGTPMREILDTLNTVNQKDEKKVVDAILSFKSAKVGEDESSKNVEVPRI